MKILRPTQGILSVTKFRRNTGEYIKILHREKRPFILTQNGQAAAIVLDPLQYEIDRDRTELIEKLIEAEEARKKGKVVSHSAVARRISKYLRTPE